jgi:hypothetical protein
MSTGYGDRMTVKPLSKWERIRVFLISEPKLDELAISAIRKMDISPGQRRRGMGQHLPEQAETSAADHEHIADELFFFEEVVRNRRAFGGGFCAPKAGALPGRATPRLRSIINDRLDTFVFTSRGVLAELKGAFSRASELPMRSSGRVARVRTASTAGLGYNHFL